MKNLHNLRCSKQFVPLYHYLVDAMKFNDLASSEHGTSSDVKRTHPLSVRNTVLSPGVGSCLSLRFGGTKIDTTNRPVRIPTNAQNRSIIYVISIIYDIDCRTCYCIAFFDTYCNIDSLSK